jgi:diaminopimelate epimerase
MLGEYKTYTKPISNEIKIEINKTAIKRKNEYSNDNKNCLFTNNFPHCITRLETLGKINSLSLMVLIRNHKKISKKIEVIVKRYLEIEVEVFIW